jgi:hypothetical protein
MLHIKVGDLHLIPFKTVCVGDTAHYIWQYTTYTVQHRLWGSHCPLEPGIYNLLPSTLSVVLILPIKDWGLNLFHFTLSLEVILPITEWDLQLIAFKPVCCCESAYYIMVTETYSILHSLWR